MRRPENIKTQQKTHSPIFPRLIRRVDTNIVVARDDED